MAKIKVLDPQMAEEIHALWKDPAVQKAHENRSKFQLPDSASHVLENAVRISQVSSFFFSFLWRRQARSHSLLIAKLRALVG